MSLFLVKHSRPDIASTTRELSKAKFGENPETFIELLSVIKYEDVFDRKNLGLKLEPSGNAHEPCEIVCFSDSDYDGNPVRRRSISGFVLYVLGVLVSW